MRQDHTATTIDPLAEQAEQAFRPFASSSGETRAQFLQAIARQIEALGDALIDCVHAESALPKVRIQGERARTTAQLRLFAELANDEAWRERRIDAAEPHRQPQPRPQLICERRPIGPVVVFGASNFPLAFSVAGGDTAAALAIGCPVIAKAHPAHPNTCRMIADAIEAARIECHLPVGVFALCADLSQASGVALVRHPAICAGAFTGSRQGGMALWRAAQERAAPIPFFAEMSSLNPVFIGPGRMAAEAESIAKGLYASMTQGVGQFCTKPGLLFVLQDPQTTVLEQTLTAVIRQHAPATMLTETIADHYRTGIAALRRLPGLDVLAEGATSTATREAGAILFATDVATFLSTPALQDECFGPSSVLIRCASIADFERAAKALSGQLTATLWQDAADAESFADLQWQLEQKAGRIVFNGFPTGVEVGTATVHGGPFPACSDARFTSVGTRAIDRFLRVVAWQRPAP